MHIYIYVHMHRIYRIYTYMMVPAGYMHMIHTDIHTWGYTYIIQHTHTHMLICIYIYMCIIHMYTWYMYISHVIIDHIVIPFMDPCCTSFYTHPIPSWLNLQAGTLIIKIARSRNLVIATMSFRGWAGSPLSGTHEVPWQHWESHGVQASLTHMAKTLEYFFYSIHVWKYHHGTNSWEIWRYKYLFWKTDIAMARTIMIC